MIVGRNLAYQPILYINKNEFLTEDISNSDYKKTFNGYPMTVNAQFYKLSQSGDKKELLPSPTVSINNIGLGVARNIKIHWIYDIEEVKTYIKGNYDEEKSYANIQNIDFISVNDYFDIFLPYGYMQLYGEKLNPTQSDLASEGQKEDTKPSISLKVNYENIYGKKYKSSFDVNIYAVDNEIKISFKETINKSSPKN